MYFTIVTLLSSFYHSDIGNPNAAEMRKDLAEFDNYTAPGVEMHCLYGKNTGDTVDEYDFFSFIFASSNKSDQNIFIIFSPQLIGSTLGNHSIPSHTFGWAMVMEP